MAMVQAVMVLAVMDLLKRLLTMVLQKPMVLILTVLMKTQMALVQRLTSMEQMRQALEPRMVIHLTLQKVMPRVATQLTKKLMTTATQMNQLQIRLMLQLENLMVSKVAAT